MSHVISIEEGDDGGDMDIGVKLSLDESGMLETEPTDQGASLAKDTSSIQIHQPQTLSRTRNLRNPQNRRTHHLSLPQDKTFLKPWMGG